MVVVVVVVVVVLVVVVVVVEVVVVVVVVVVAGALNTRLQVRTIPTTSRAESEPRTMRCEEILMALSFSRFGRDLSY